MNDDNLQGDNLYIIDDKKNKKRTFNERNAGRKNNEPDMIAKKMFFDGMVMGGFTEKEIIDEMGISAKTYGRYYKDLEAMSYYYEAINVYPVTIRKGRYYNRYRIMASYLEAILKSENAVNIDENWKEKAKERIKDFDKMASLETQGIYKLFKSRQFDDIIMGYAKSAFDYIKNNHWRDSVKKAAETVEESFMRVFLGEMHNGISPEDAERLSREDIDTDELDRIRKNSPEEVVQETTVNEESAGLDYGKMKELRYMYENDIDPEPDSEEYNAFMAYKAWADQLKMTGMDMYLKCLSCPGMFRIVGDDMSRYGCEDLEECELDCAQAYRECDLESYGYREKLFEYYLS